MTILSVLATAAAVLLLGFLGLFRGSWKLLRAMLELIQLLVRIKRQTKKVTSPEAKRRGWSTVDMFLEAVGKHPDQPMIIMADSGATVTYAEMDARSNRVAQWLVQAKGFAPGTTVALLMPNCIDYVAIWLGVAKAGGCTALVNTNLSGASLVHAIKTALADPSSSSSASGSGAGGSSGASGGSRGGVRPPPPPVSPRRLLVTSAALSRTALQSNDTRAALAREVGADLDIVELDPPSEEAKGSYGGGGGGGGGGAAAAMAAAAAAAASALVDGGPLGSFSTEPVAESLRRPGAAALSTLFYIYTSGTTGLPKASRINHLRFWSAGCTLWTLCRLDASDRLYCALPLYHASGGMMGVSACVLSGAALVLRPKFSVSSFSRDLTEHRCTAVQYIGELCRYLAAAKPNPLDGSQRIKCAAGNGLRPEVWERFARRYNVGHVVEFYAATEGNTNLFNNTGKVGAVGVVPWFARFVYPVRLAKFDEDKGELVRDPVTGLGAVCRPGEVGQVLGLIKEGDPMRRFDGYTDRAATEKKVARGVFAAGDRYFLSGDLMRQDAWGFFFWHDRIGDTFRWKGENVSTAEVAFALSQALGEQLADVNVYGVEVPHTDGRAGMAALSLAEGLSAKDVDWPSVHTRLAAELAPYAQPVFLRVARQLSYTSTFKHKKTDLRNEGYRLQRHQPQQQQQQQHTAGGGGGGPDTVLVRDPQAGTYVRLTEEMEDRIASGLLRL